MLCPNKTFLCKAGEKEIAEARERLGEQLFRQSQRQWNYCGTAGKY